MRRNSKFRDNNRKKSLRKLSNRQKTRKFNKMSSAILELYPDTGGNVIQIGNPISNDQIDDCSEVEIYSYTTSIMGDAVGWNPIGDCFISYLDSKCMGSEENFKSYTCSGFCCDGGEVDGYPENGDGVIDIHNKDYYESQAEWQCWDETFGVTNDINWVCVRTNSNNVVTDTVSYDMFEEHPSLIYGNGCKLLDMDSCRAWEEKGWCKVIDTSSANMGGCDDLRLCMNSLEDNFICIDMVDNMGRSIIDEETVMSAHIFDEITECCPCYPPEDYVPLYSCEEAANCSWGCALESDCEAATMMRMCNYNMPNPGWGQGPCYC